MSYIEYVTADNQSENPLQDLAQANQFTMADLESNRSGKISDTQWFRLLLRAMQPVRYSGGALLGWLLCCFVVKTFVPRILLWIASLLGAKSIGVLFGAVTLTCAAAFVLALLKSAQTTALLVVDLKQGKVACLEGRVTASHEHEQGLGMARLYGEAHANYWYVCKNEYFEVDEPAFSALPMGGQYRLYYTPKSKLLLSIEPK
jgi:hypothetical protein